MTTGRINQVTISPSAAWIPLGQGVPPPTDACPRGQKAKEPPFPPPGPAFVTRRFVSKKAFTLHKGGGGVNLPKRQTPPPLQSTGKSTLLPVLTSFRSNLPLQRKLGSWPSKRTTCRRNPTHRGPHPTADPREIRYIKRFGHQQATHTPFQQHRQAPPR